MFVASLRRSLRDRGVSLRHHYPELHDLLDAYADTGEAFAPVTIRPVDAVSGQSFACSIAVPSAEDGDWWASEHLLGDHPQVSACPQFDSRSDVKTENCGNKKVISTEL
ncbi:hypothetical protein BOX15_Mlig026199g3 [Macrostomum lignano]|nr:hypothetical protein BOX15_Mlig026199g3 [Macrostomum lignano]